MKCITYSSILVPIDGKQVHIDAGEEFECDEQTGKYLIASKRAEEVVNKPVVPKKKAAD